MGGCCSSSSSSSSSRKLQLQGTPVCFYCPPSLEEYESLTSHDGVSARLNSRMLVDLHLNMSTPDTFRPPPAPAPYDAVLRAPQSTDVKSLSDMNLKEGDQAFFPNTPTKVNLEISMLNALKVSKTDEEEDVCPTCLEEYDLENPKIVAKCNHHFHLWCILEWQERSDTCLFVIRK